MKLDLFDTYGKEYYETVVYEVDRICLLLNFYTTKAEAVKAVKDFKKSYKGKYQLDCFVRRHDEYGFAIADYDV